MPSKNQSIDPRFVPLAVAGALFVALVYITYLSAVTLTGGTFVYSLDDPYIHLTVARRIASGAYGFNSGEFAAPCSSILWPFLLAPFVALGIGELAPFGLNLLFSGGVLWTAFRLVSPKGALGTAFLGIFVVATNLVGLCFQGMEHVLQLWLTLAAVLGLVRLEEEDAPPGWLAPVLILGPLARFENLAASGLAILWLLYRRRFQTAALAGAGIALGVGGFALFLMAHGFGPLPTSVTAKAALSNGLSPLAALTGNLRRNLGHAEGIVSLALVAGLATFALNRSARPSFERALAALGSLILLAHLLGGAFAFGRYEIYAWGTALALLGRRAAGRGRLWTFAPWAAAIGGLPFAFHTFGAPAASLCIYEQQYQLSRFVAECWRRPIAVNDIGLVGWRGGTYVLDLYGLAYPPALRAFHEHESPEWMDAPIRDHKVGMAAVYDIWFPKKPAGWVRLGTLALSRPGSYVGGNLVGIWATAPEEVPAARAALEKLLPTLPPKVTLELEPPQTAAQRP